MLTEVEAFLKRILAYPDDDSPRLIFADWLEETAEETHRLPQRGTQLERDQWGPDRSQFIRVQIGIARIQEEESREIEQTGWVDRRGTHQELRDLYREEQRLLAMHHEQWEAPFEGLARGLVFRRGFVEQANVGALELLRHAHELFALSPLRRLRLMDVGESLQSLFHCSHLSRLSELTIHGQHSREALARAVAQSQQLTMLRSLHLTGNDFEDDAAQHLANCQTLGNLRELDLSENRLGETSAQMLAASSAFGALRVLELGNNRIGPIGAETIACSERLTNLYRLGLASNEIGAARIHNLSRTQGFFRVPVLDLTFNSLGAPELHILFNRVPRSGETFPNRLRQLDLSRNPLGDHGMRVLAVCPHLEGLQVLRLAGCGVGDDGVRVLAEGPYLNNLLELDLSNNPISDTGCRVLLHPPQLRKLKRPLTRFAIASEMTQSLDREYPERRY